jgi:SAM-dependent methyltransferase
VTAGVDMLAERVLARIDRAKLAELARKFAGHPFEKYFDVERWVRVNVARARLLELHQSQRRTVLDLGAGFGYFLLVCRELGHDVQGVDLHDPLYVAVTELLGVPVAHHRIEASKPLPFPSSADVVTAHMVCFNGHGSRSLWGVRDWTMFLERFVGTTLHLELNRERDGTLYPRGVAELFGDRGAVITQHHVVFAHVRAGARA